MKHKFYIVLLACIVNFSTLSCKKEQVVPPGYQRNGTGASGNNNNSSQPPNLVANSWKSNQNGIWVHNFKNILSVNDAKNVKVYLLRDGAEIPINQFYLFYEWYIMGNFHHNRCGYKLSLQWCNLPFTYLDIKVVTE